MLPLLIQIERERVVFAINQIFQNRYIEIKSLKTTKSPLDKKTRLDYEKFIARVSHKVTYFWDTMSSREDK